jgi:hypothetical protein
MTTSRRICETVHLTALGLWLGSLVMTGVAAAIVFPLVKGLDPSLPGYAGYTGEHWLILAGHVAQRIFVAADFVQLIAGVLVLATIGLMLSAGGAAWRKRIAWIRVIAVALSMIVLAYHIFVLGPRMSVELASYWRAAGEGENDTAMVHKERFDAMHPVASGVMGTAAICVLLALVAGAWHVTTPEPSGPTSPVSR